MKWHCSVCRKARRLLSSAPSDMSAGRKGRVIKSLSMGEREKKKDQERKGTNPETIFDNDSPPVHASTQIWTE